MNSSQLWIEPKKPRPISSQAIVAACLLAVLLLGTSAWQTVSTTISPPDQTFFATKSR